MPHVTPRRRIVLHCDSPVCGGFEQLVARLANALARAGHDIEFLYWHATLGALAGEPRIRKTRLPAPAGTPLPFLHAFAPARLWRLVRALRARREALVVICQGSIELGAGALLAARLAGIPTVSYLAYAFDLRTLGMRFAALRERVDRGFYRLPEHFITLSEFQGELVSTRVATPVHVIPMVVPVCTILPPRSRAPDAALEIGVVGAISFGIKGQDVLPGVALELERSSRPFAIHVIGDGPDLAELRACVDQSGLGARFTFHGLLPHDVASDRMHAMDVLVIPSTTEGAVPLVAFEGLAGGTPFVMTRVDSTRDWRIPADLQFDRDSAPDIVRAIDAALAFRDSTEFEPFQRRMLASVSEEAFEAAVTRVFDDLLAVPRAGTDAHA